jgi:hypothetical protein
MRVYDSGLEETTAAPEVPAGPDDLASHYDLTISHPRADFDRFAVFDRWLARSAADHGLRCAVIHEEVVHEALRRLESSRLRIGYHLDYFALWHVPGDLYARLSLAVQDTGGRPVNSPARARAFTDKAAAHAELLRHGLGVPPAVVIRPWAAGRTLTPAQRDALRLHESGAGVYIKPAHGYAGRGVVYVGHTDPQTIEAALASARECDRGDAILVQRAVCPPLLPCEDGVDRPAYWRVLHCLDEWMLFWWQPQDRVGPGRPSYRMVSPAELRRHRLQPVLAYAKALAALTGLDWFSTELCLGDGPDPSRFTVPGPDGRERAVLAIDYVNDQCDVVVQSHWPGGLPDLVVRRLASRFAEEAWRVRQQALRPATLAPCRAA